jgi:hypothetical protein
MPSICEHCARLILPNEARWTAREPREFWHYECAEAEKLTSRGQFKALILARPDQTG